MNNDYFIGAILYVVVRGENRVRPMRVVEEILRRNFDGVHKTYMLSTGDGADPISIDDLDADFYSSPSEVKDALVQKASATISRIVDNAVEKATVLFPDAQVHEVAKGSEQGVKAS